MLREGIEDSQRHRSDTELNSSKCTVFRNGKITQITWADVKVGDICYVIEKENFPADIILLASSIEDGSCFIETSSLDGEKNLKPKSACPDSILWF